MSQTISSTLGSRSASAAPSPRPTADVHQGIMWPMDPMPIEVTPTPMPVEVTQMPTDPANFWLGLIAAVGLFALSSFPAWDRLVRASTAGQKVGIRRGTALVTVGFLLPLSMLWMALGSLAQDPVPKPDDGQTAVALLALAVLVAVRAFFPLLPEVEQATSPSVATTVQEPSLRPRKRGGVTLQDTALAALVIGAFVKNRLRR